MIFPHSAQFFVFSGSNVDLFAVRAFEAQTELQNFFTRVEGLKEVPQKLQDRTIVERSILCASEKA